MTKTMASGPPPPPFTLLIGGSLLAFHALLPRRELCKVEGSWRTNFQLSLFPPDYVPMSPSDALSALNT